MASKPVGFNFIISLRQPGPFGSVTAEGTDFNCLFQNNTLSITNTQKHDMRYPIGPYGGRSHTQDYKFKNILDDEDIKKLEEKIRIYYNGFKDQAHNIQFPTSVCRELESLVHMRTSLKEYKSKELKEELKVQKELILLHLFSFKTPILYEKL